MAQRMFGDKVIPWIAASKSSDQKQASMYKCYSLFKAYTVFPHIVAAATFLF